MHEAVLYKSQGGGPYTLGIAGSKMYVDWESANAKTVLLLGIKKKVLLYIPNKISLLSESEIHQNKTWKFYSCKSLKIYKIME